MTLKTGGEEEEEGKGQRRNLILRGRLSWHGKVERGL